VLALAKKLNEAMLTEEREKAQLGSASRPLRDRLSRSPSDAE